MKNQIKIALATLSLAILSGCSGGKGADNSPCGKAASALRGIVLLEVGSEGKDPSILDTFETQLAAECKATKVAETHKEALECYDANRDAIGYRLFKSCPEEPGKALIAAVVAKH